MSFASAFSSEFTSEFGSDPSFMVEFDHDGDGDFSEDSEIITSYVTRATTFRGKDDASNLKGVSVAGTAALDLLNLDGAWSKFNTSSPFYGELKPGRRIRVMSRAPYAEVLFSGELDRVQPHVSNGGLPRATLYALGVLSKLASDKAIISPPAMEDATTGLVINQVLDTLDFPAADRDIDDGAVYVARWYPSENQALGLAREMEEQEGGEFYEGKDFDLVFRDRYDRLLNHSTPVVTFTDDGSGLGYREIEQADPLKNVFNSFSATIPALSEADEQTVWSLTDPFILAAGETRTYFVPMPSGFEYIHEWTSVEITVVGGGVASALLTVDSGEPQSLAGIAVVTLYPFAKALKLIIENTDSVPETVTQLEVSAIPVTAGQSYTITDEDAASIADFGRLHYPFTSRWFHNDAYARSSMAYELARHKDEHPILTKTIVGSDVDLFEQCVTRDLGDCVTVEAESAQTQLGINLPFNIESIRQEFAVGQLLRTTFTLAPVIDVYDGESLFILDTSELDGSEVLAY